MKKNAYTRERLSWSWASPPTAPPGRRALHNLVALVCALLEGLAVWRLGIPNVELTINLHEGPENGKVTYRGLIFLCNVWLVFGVGRRLGF